MPDTITPGVDRPREAWRHKTLPQLLADLRVARQTETERADDLHRADQARWVHDAKPAELVRLRDAWRRADRLYAVAHMRRLALQERVRLKQIEIDGGPRPCDHSVERPAHRHRRPA